MSRITLVITEHNLNCLIIFIRSFIFGNSFILVGAGSGAYPWNTGRVAKTHPEWDASPVLLYDYNVVLELTCITNTNYKT